MAADEHPGKKTAGSMLFFNVRNKIFAQWDAHMKTYLPRREPFFAYIVHGTRMGVDDEPDDDHWYDQQSNTVPIYITEVELTPEESYYFPKLLFPVMEVFIPGLILSKEEFPPERSNKLNALEYTGDQRRLFFENLKTSIEELHAYVLQQGKRQDAKHFGKSLGQVKAAIRGCGEEDPSNIQGDVNIPAPEGTLQTPQRYTRVLRPVKDFLAHYDTSISWLSKEDWVLEQKRTQLVYESELGALGKDATPLQMLGLLEEELKSCLEVTKRGASIRGVIMCSLVSKKLNQPPKKAKIAKEQTTMALNLNFKDFDTIFRNKTMVNSLVFLIRRKDLEILIENRQKNIIDAGNYGIVISQSNDMRRIHIKPPLPAEEDLDPGEQFMCVLLTDLHQYLFLYESFKATAKRLRLPEDNAIAVDMKGNPLAPKPSKVKSTNVIT